MSLSVDPDRLSECGELLRPDPALLERARAARHLLRHGRGSLDPWELLGLVVWPTKAVESASDVSTDRRTTRDEQLVSTAAEPGS